MVVALAQFVSQRVEDFLQLVREATKDQHRFGGDGVNDITDFRVIEQQIDEPCDLDIVDGDLWFA